jgi:hypothetical protein
MNTGLAAGASFCSALASTPPVVESSTTDRVPARRAPPRDR